MQSNSVENESQVNTSKHHHGSHHHGSHHHSSHHHSSHKSGHSHRSHSAEYMRQKKNDYRKKKDNPRRLIRNKAFKNFKRVVFCLILAACIIFLCWLMLLPEEELGRIIDQIRRAVPGF